MFLLLRVLSPFFSINNSEDTY